MGLIGKGFKMFKRYNIADIIVEVDSSGKTFQKQSADYLYDGDRPTDIKIKVPDDIIQQQQKSNPHLSTDDIDYILTGFDFYRKVLDFGAFFMHSSAVAYNGHAYLFSANCGTGKSTHTSFWQKNFGQDKALIINDDKPLIIKKNGIYYAAGTPWSGKSDKNLNLCFPIAGIAIIERDLTNSIESISPIDAFKELYNQTYRPYQQQQIDKLLVMFNDFLSNVNFFRLKCNMSCQAAQVAYNAMCPKL